MLENTPTVGSGVHWYEWPAKKVVNETALRGYDLLPALLHVRNMRNAPGLLCERALLQLVPHPVLVCMCYFIESFCSHNNPRSPHFSAPGRQAPIPSYHQQ
jgi:hypothetical protein